MALIKCSECGKEVSDKAAACPNCGNPICPPAQQPADSLKEAQLCCPHCGSTQLHAEQKGFSSGKAIAGALTIGNIGLLAGTIGSKDVVVTCLACGKKTKAGELKTSYSDNQKKELEEEIKKILCNRDDVYSVDKARKLFMSQLDVTEKDWDSFFNTFVQDIKNGKLTEEQKAIVNSTQHRGNGCASMIAFGVVVGASLWLCL